MIGANIKKLRLEHGMTQKALADKLFVSAQAVSRWENDEVEPSLGTIMELAKIFDVSADEILGMEGADTKKEPEPKVIEKTEYVYREPPKQVLALCHKCNSPIYKQEDIVRDYFESGDQITCKKCHQRQKEELRNRKIEKAERRRTMSFWIGGLSAGAWLLFWIFANGFISFPLAVFGILVTVCLFTFISCCLLANNFVGDVTLEVLTWGFVKMPGLIFTFDLDGCLWFIGMKILFFVLGILLALAAAALAFAIGGIVSLFVYPFALAKNINRPEETEI